MSQGAVSGSPSSSQATRCLNHSAAWSRLMPSAPASSSSAALSIDGASARAARGASGTHACTASAGAASDGAASDGATLESAAEREEELRDTRPRFALERSRLRRAICQPERTAALVGDCGACGVPGPDPRIPLLAAMGVPHLPGGAPPIELPIDPELPLRIKSDALPPIPPDAFLQSREREPMDAERDPTPAAAAAAAAAALLLLSVSSAGQMSAPLPSPSADGTACVCETEGRPSIPSLSAPRAASDASDADDAHPVLAQSAEHPECWALTRTDWMGDKEPPTQDKRSDAGSPCCACSAPPHASIAHDVTPTGAAAEGAAAERAGAEGSPAGAAFLRPQRGDRRSEMLATSGSVVSMSRRYG